MTKNTPDIANLSPFVLLRDYHMSHRQILKAEAALRKEGRQMWDWDSYAYLYREDIALAVRRAETLSYREGVIKRKIFGEEDVDFRKLYEALDERTRHILYLRYFKHLTFLEIGNILGISDSSAHRACKLGEARLKECARLDHRKII